MYQILRVILLRLVWISSSMWVAGMCGSMAVQHLYVGGACLTLSISPLSRGSSTGGLPQVLALFVLV